MNIILKIVLSILIFTLATGCANTSRVTKYKGKIKINKEVEIPNRTSLVIYMPDATKKQEIWANSKLNRLGKAVIEATDTAFDSYFSDVTWFDANSSSKASLYLKVKPTWERVAGNIEMTFNYALLDGSGKQIKQGIVKESKSFNFNIDAVFYNLAFNGINRISALILNSIKPTPEMFPTLTAMNNFDLELLIDTEKAIRTGTGFYINETGDVVTASHVVKDCLITKVNKDNETINSVTLAESKLLDIAVLKTGSKTSDYLRFKEEDKLSLGESLTTVSYPLNGLLATSPNMTFGHVTSKKALANSLGLFQFSAPIQPGSSGGAIVSADSKVFGVVTSTLDIKGLAEKGVIPQSVNFALDAKYLKKFLKKNDIEYTTKYAQSVNDSKEYALQTAVQLACYQ